MWLSNTLVKNRIFICYLAILILLSLYMLHVFMPADLIYYGDDLTFHLQRLKALGKAFGNGTFPVYIDYEAAKTYGYGAKWFYSDFTLIPFVPFIYFSDIAFGYKAILFILTIICGLAAYFSLFRVLKDNYAAFIGGILYTFCIYRIYLVFFRAAIGEIIAFSILPIIIYGFYEIARRNYKKWYILSISFSVLLYSHLLSSVLVVGTLLLLFLISYKSFIDQPKRFFYLILSGVVCLLLTSYFLFPFVEQMLSNTFYLNKYRFFYIGNYTFSFTEFISALAKGVILTNYLAPSVGFILLIPQLLRFFIKDKSTPYLRYADIALILGILFLVTNLDIFPWSIPPFNKMNILQFPSRFLSISTLFLTFSGSCYISIFFKSKKSRLLVTSVIVLLIILCNFICVNDTLTKDKYKLTALYQLETGMGEYYPANLWVAYMIEKGDRVFYKNSSTEVGPVKKNSGITSFNVKIEKPDTLEIPLLYYKGYSASLNSEELQVLQSNNGLIELPVQESGSVIVSFTGTFLQKYSIYLTLISFVLLIGYIFLFRKKINERPESK